MFALGALLAPVASATDSGDIVVVSLKGEVHFTMQGRARSIRAGGLLEPPVTLRTGRDGSVELRQGATTLSVGPETLLEFPALEKPGAPIDRIVQPLGNVFYNIGKRPGRKLRIETPYLVGVVKGTQFNVAAGDGTTTISLFEGLLEVRAADNSSVIDLHAGEIASRGHDAPAINVLKMSAGKDTPKATAPPAPRPSSGNGTGKDPAPAPSRDAPRTDDRDSIFVENPIAPTNVTLTTANVPTVAPVETPAVSVEQGPAVAVNTPDTNVGVSVETPPASAVVDAGVSTSVPVVDNSPIVVPPVADVAVDVAVEPDSGNSGTSVIVGASAPQVEVEVTVGNVDLGVSADVDLGLVDEDTGNGHGNGNANGYGTDNGNGNDSGSDNGNANGNGNSNGNGNGSTAAVTDLLDSLTRRSNKK